MKIPMTYADGQGETHFDVQNIPTAKAYSVRGWPPRG